MTFAEGMFINTFRALVGSFAHKRDFLRYWLEQANRLNWIDFGTWEIGSLNLAMLCVTDSSLRDVVVTCIERHPAVAESGKQTDALLSDFWEPLSRLVCYRAGQGDHLADESFLECAWQIHPALCDFLCRMLQVNATANIAGWLDGEQQQVSQIGNSPFSMSAGAIRTGLARYPSNQFRTLPGSILASLILRFQHFNPSPNGQQVVDRLPELERSLMMAVQNLEFNSRLIVLAIVYGGFTIEHLKDGAKARQQNVSVEDVFSLLNRGWNETFRKL